MSRQVRITVAETSAIIRSGMVSVLKLADLAHAEIFEIDDIDELRNALNWQKPDILIINPSFFALYSLQQIRKDMAGSDVKFVALQGVMSDSNVQRYYDDTITLYDTAEQVKEKISRLAGDNGNDRRHESLSQREKQVIACVIQGMTNKQIADKLFLSTHTVITHRRNISAKLDIHSTAGLTIYAIVNKLVDLDSISAESAENQG